MNTSSTTQRLASRSSAVAMVAACVLAAPLGACQGYEGHKGDLDRDDELERVDPTPAVDAEEEVNEAAAAVSEEMQARAELNAEVAKARMDELEARARKVRDNAKKRSADAADDVEEEFDEAHAEAKAAFAELSADADEAGDQAKARMAKALDAMSKELAEWESELDDEHSPS